MEKPDPFPGAYAVDSVCKGVAFYVLGYEVQADDDTEWTGILERTGRLVAVMVGDDRRYVVDEEDVRRLKRAEYCGSCGQMGCGCDTGGEDESE